MGQILAWKCETTGELFEDQDLYKKHIRKIAAQRREQAKRDRIAAELKNFWINARNTITSINDLPQFFIDHQDRLWEDAIAAEHYRFAEIGKLVRGGKKMPMPKLLRFTTFRLSWSKSVSNSHSCPQGGITNWGGRVKDGPRGYPGWTGRVDWEIEWPNEFDGWYPGADLFKGYNSCVHTGSGGGGNNKNNISSFGYSVELFAADWPGLYREQAKREYFERENRKKANAWKELGGNPSHVPLITEIPEDWVPPDVWAL